MTLSVKHAFNSAKPDGVDTSIVRPSNWNEEHLITASADTILGAVNAGQVGEIACTAAGRALIDDADAAAQRATLGLVIGTNIQAYVGAPWTVTTPTVTALAGTFTTVSATVAYTTIGKTLIVNGTVTVTNAGTATTAIAVPLPASIVRNGTFSAANNGLLVPKLGRLIAGSATAYIYQTNGGAADAISAGEWTFQFVAETI